MDNKATLSFTPGTGSWGWFFFLLIVAVAVVAGYLEVTRASWRTEHGQETVPSAQRASFVCGMAITFLAWVSPMDLLGARALFTVHMLQHLLLSLAGPPLILQGFPGNWFARLNRQHLLPAWSVPAVGAVLLNGNLWIWHAPPLFAAMMLQPGLHLLANLLYVVTGILFWWPLLGPPQGGKEPLSLLGKLLYLFFSDQPMMLLGAGLTFSAPLYTVMRPPPSHMQPISAVDQQLGGLLMWIGGTLFFIVIGSLFFLRWMLRQEKAEHDQEASASQVEVRTQGISG